MLAFASGPVPVLLSAGRAGWHRLLMARMFKKRLRGERDDSSRRAAGDEVVLGEITRLSVLSNWLKGVWLEAAYTANE